MGQPAGTGGQQKGGQPPAPTGASNNPTYPVTSDPQQTATTQPSQLQYNNAITPDTSYQGWLKQTLGSSAPNFSNAGSSPWTGFRNTIAPSQDYSQMASQMSNTIFGKGGAPQQAGGVGGAGGKPGKGGLPPGLNGDTAKAALGNAGGGAGGGAGGEAAAKNYGLTGDYATDLAAYRKANPTQDDQGWLKGLGQEQATWLQQNPDRKTNPDGTPLTSAAPAGARTTTPYVPPTANQGGTRSLYGGGSASMAAPTNYQNNPDAYKGSGLGGPGNVGATSKDQLAYMMALPGKTGDWARQQAAAQYGEEGARAMANSSQDNPQIASAMQRLMQGESPEQIMGGPSGFNGGWGPVNLQMLQSLQGQLQNAPR